MVKECPRAPAKGLKRAGTPPLQFKARYVSECYSCGELIQKGEVIERDRNDRVHHVPPCPDQIEWETYKKPTKFVGKSIDDMGY